MTPDPIRKATGYRGLDPDTEREKLTGRFSVLTHRNTDNYVLIVLDGTAGTFYLSLPRRKLVEDGSFPGILDVRFENNRHVFQQLSHGLRRGMPLSVSPDRLGFFARFTRNPTDRDCGYSALPSRRPYRFTLAFATGKKRYLVLESFNLGPALKEVHLDKSCRSLWRDAVAHPERYRYRIGSRDNPLAEFIVPI